MPSILFPHADMADPYAFYNYMLATHPVYFDEARNTWGIYEYASCKAILEHPLAHIPTAGSEGLNEYASAIAGSLARLSNSPQHLITRQVVAALFARMKPVDTSSIMTALMPPPAVTHIDWVATIGKTLPLTCILQSFGLSTAGNEWLAERMNDFTNIMLLQKTPGQVEKINSVSRDIYCLLEKHLTDSGLWQAMANAEPGIPADRLRSLCISNLAGLLIQCYDAGRGLLTNTLLQLLQRSGFAAATTMDYLSLQQLVVETLRFDPPVHTTRRIAMGDIQLNNASIKKGQNILLVLAAANRDPAMFHEPGVFNTSRPNNNEHLTFGTGAHRCIADRFSVDMATAALHFMLKRYAMVRCTEDTPVYEPLPNLRLVKKLFIELSPRL